MASWGQPFEDDLFKDIMPYVESHYPVLTDASHRAIAGLSMGGGQSLNIGLKHTDTFAWIGGFSSAPNLSPSATLVPDAAAAAALASKARFIWVSCGDSDGLVNNSLQMHNGLKQMNVPHIWHLDSGGHTWPVWTNDLYLVSQQLFKDQKDWNVKSTPDDQMPAQLPVGGGGRGRGGRGQSPAAGQGQGQPQP